MNKYNERLRDGSVPYRMGRTNNVPSSVITVHWTSKDRKDYKRGQRDRKKLLGRNKRRNLLGDILTLVGGLIVGVIAVVGWALLCALPFIVGGLVLHWAGVI